VGLFKQYMPIFITTLFFLHLLNAMIRSQQNVNFVTGGFDDRGGGDFCRDSKIPGVKAGIDS
jgi:hypothetical protein